MKKEKKENEKCSLKKTIKYFDTKNVVHFYPNVHSLIIPFSNTKQCGRRQKILYGLIARWKSPDVVVTFQLQLRIEKISEITQFHFQQIRLDGEVTLVLIHKILKLSFFLIE